MLQGPPAGCSGRCCCSADWPGPVRSRVAPAWHDREAGWDVPGCNFNGLLPRILLPTLKACLPVHSLCGSGLDRNQGRLQKVASGTQESRGYRTGLDHPRSRPTLRTGLVSTAGLCPAKKPLTRMDHGLPLLLQIAMPALDAVLRCVGLKPINAVDSCQGLPQFSNPAPKAPSAH